MVASNSNDTLSFHSLNGNSNTTSNREPFEIDAAIFLGESALQFIMRFREFLERWAEISGVIRNFSFLMNVVRIGEIELRVLIALQCLDLRRIALRVRLLRRVMFRELSAVAHRIEILQAHWVVWCVHRWSKFFLWTGSLIHQTRLPACLLACRFESEIKKSILNYEPIIGDHAFRHPRGISVHTSQRNQLIRVRLKRNRCFFFTLLVCEWAFKKSSISLVSILEFKNRLLSSLESNLEMASSERVSLHTSCLHETSAYAQLYSLIKFMF